MYYDMPNVSMENLQLSYDIRYSKNRRTVQIRIVSAGHVLVIAPAGLPREKIEQILHGRQLWIARHMKKLALIQANPANKTLGHGATLLFQGAAHVLLLTGDGGANPYVSRTEGAVTVHLDRLVGEEDDPDVRRLLLQWFFTEAAKKLNERTRYWSGLTGLAPQRLGLRDQKTRWGSCSSRGGINFNWRIIMAPPSVLDYLVVHELCHLRHPNHSPAYWREVAQWVPDFAVSRRWLRTNGRLLTGIFT